MNVGSRYERTVANGGTSGCSQPEAAALAICGATVADMWWTWRVGQTRPPTNFLNTCAILDGAVEGALERRGDHCPVHGPVAARGIAPVYDTIRKHHGHFGRSAWDTAGRDPGRNPRYTR